MSFPLALLTTRIVCQSISHYDGTFISITFVYLIDRLV